MVTAKQARANFEFLLAKAEVGGYGVWHSPLTAGMKYDMIPLQIGFFLQQ